MVELVGARLALGLVRQPEEVEPGLPGPLHERSIHAVVPDVEESDLGRGPRERGTDPGGIGAVTQGGNVDHRNLAGIDESGARANSHGCVLGKLESDGMPGVYSGAERMVRA